MELKTFQVDNLLLLEYGNGAASDVLTNLEGWDTYANIEIKTEPKMIGAGSYVISTHVGEREITFTAAVESTNPKAIRNTFAAKLGNTVTMTRRYFTDGVETYKEIMTGYVTSVTGWDRINDHANLAVTVKCVNPYKTTYINGSSTPESTTRL